MKTRRKWIRAALQLTTAAFALTMGQGQIAVAQSSPPARYTTAPTSEAGFTLEEVVVTAQHREEKLRDVPMGISALTEDTLDKLQERSFEDYASLIPGLALQQGGSGLPGSNRLTMRGLNAGGVGSTVAVYVDDSPFGSSSAVANGGSFSGNFDPWDMQRIEVLRGPQGMFYGASSEGGLIKFVTNAPKIGAFGAKVEVGAENSAEGSFGWSGKGMLNLPLGDNTALRVSAYNEHIPGFVDDPFRKKQDVNDGERTGIRASLLFFPTSTLSVRLTAFEQVLQYSGTSYIDADRHTMQPLYGDLTQQRAIDENLKYVYKNYNATVNWNLGWANLSSITSYHDSQDTPFVDLTFQSDGGGGTLGGYFSNPTNYPDQTGPLPTHPIGLSLINQATVKKFTQELRLQSAASDRLEWEAGLFYTRESGKLYQPFSLFNISDGSHFGPPGYLYFLNILDSSFKEKAAFGSVTYHFNSAFDIQVGGRYSENKQFNSLLQASDFLLFPATVTAESTSSSHKSLYSFAPRWHVTNDLLVYARVATGYQPGGGNSLPPNPVPGTPTEFGPDSTVNYELGARTRLFNQRLSVDVTAFRIDWSKIQLNGVAFATDGSSIGITVNGGTARSQGLEWTFGVVPIQGLSLSWTGAYIDATLTSLVQSGIGGKAGDRLPGSSRLSTSLDSEYAWSVAGLQAYVGSTWSYSGTQVSDFSVDNNGARIPPAQIAGYTSVNLRAGLKGQRWGVSLYAKNVANKRAVLVFADSGADGIPATVVYNAPRVIGVSANRAF